MAKAKTAKRAKRSKVTKARAPAAAATKGEPMLVRLKPYNLRRRHVMRTYVHAPTGKKFEERRGWYAVDSDLAEYLAKVQQIESDDTSPPAFDVCTKAEAQALDERERRQATRVMAGDVGGDLKTSDLRRRAEVPSEAHGDRFAGSRMPPPARGARSMRPIDATD